MRLLITGVSGLVGSNLAAAAVQQSWEVLGTWRDTPVEITGASTIGLDMADRHACVEAAVAFEPDVLIHAALGTHASHLEHDPYAAQLALLGTVHTLAAARNVRAHYVLVSSDWVYSGMLPPHLRWSEEDPPGTDQRVGARAPGLRAGHRRLQRLLADHARRRASTASTSPVRRPPASSRDTYGRTPACRCT